MDTYSVIRCGGEVNIRSIHQEEDSNIWVGSLIIWCNPNCDEMFSIALPSMSFLHQLLDFALKLPRSTTRNGFFCFSDSIFSSRFSLKDSNRSCDWLGDLYSGMNLQSLSPTTSSNLTHSLNNWHRWFLKADNSCSIYKHLHVFYLTDDRNALNYNLEFPNCYHQAKYLNQDTFLISKLCQIYELSLGFKQDQLRKIMCSQVIRFQL